MIYVFLANGFEEVEGLATVDILRRFELSVKTVGVGGKSITGSHGITVLCDLDINEIEPDGKIEAVVLPGGMPGTTNLEKSSKVQAFVDYAYSNKKLLCAICAAPIILGHKGLLRGYEAICFPGFESELTDAIISDKFVYKDGLIITAKGVGSAIEFGLKIAEFFVGADRVRRTRETLQCP